MAPGPLLTDDAPALSPQPQPEPAVVPAPRIALPPVPSFRPIAPPPNRPRQEVTPSRAARRGQSRAQRSRARRRAGLAAVVVVVLLAVAVAALLVREVTRTEAPAPPAAGRTQTTVLFALGDASADGDEAALLAGDPAAQSASVALLPSRTLTTVIGRGQLPLGRAVAGPDATTATAAVSDLLGVTVDGLWRLSPETFAALVDGVGGVTVDVDRDVVQSGVVVLRAGTGQRLTGPLALAFAQSLDPTEDEAARLSRLQGVLDSLLGALPTDPAALQASLGALGPGSESTLPVPRLAGVLADLAAARTRSAAPVFSILPVTTLESGGDAVAYRVDPAGLRDYVQANLAASVPPGALSGGTRVFVYNGTLTYGVGTAARARLVAAGMSFVGSKNETQGGRVTSVVLVRDATEPERRRGEQVATALGLPASAVQVADHQQDAADVVVLTGADFAVTP